MAEPPDITLLLKQAASSSSAAADQLLPAIYDELRDLARRQLHRESPAHTLQATALVHEAYLRLIDQTRASYNDRNHFFAVAATAMRRILIDHARTKGRQKRGGGQRRVELDNLVEAAESQGVDLVALDSALTNLALLDPRKAQLVELRFFAGLPIHEAACALGISLATAKREWALARGFLYREVQGNAL